MPSSRPASSGTTNPAVRAEVHPRAAGEETVAAVAADGVNVSIVRLPQVHDPIKQGLISPAIEMYRAKGNQIDKLAEITAKDSIGILYSVITLHLGFDFNSDEYKIMGLAPYGDPSRYRHFFEQAVELLPNGTIKIFERPLAKRLTNFKSTPGLTSPFASSRATSQRAFTPKHAGTRRTCW